MKRFLRDFQFFTVLRDSVLKFHFKRISNRVYSLCFHSAPKSPSSSRYLEGQESKDNNCVTQNYRIRCNKSRRDGSRGTGMSLYARSDSRTDSRSSRDHSLTNTSSKKSRDTFEVGPRLNLDKSRQCLTRTTSCVSSPVNPLSLQTWSRTLHEVSVVRTTMNQIVLRV